MTSIFSQNVQAFNGAINVMKNIVGKTSNIGYNSNKNLTTIAGYVNVEALGVLGKPVALREDLATKANANHTHDISNISLAYEEEETYEEETINEEEETVIENKTRTITKYKPLSEILAGKASTTHNHDTIYSPLSHTHTISNITDWPSTFTPSSHTHTISEIEDYVPTDLSNCAKLNANNIYTGVQTFINQINQLNDQQGHMAFFIGKSQLTNQCGTLAYYAGNGTPYMIFNLYNSDGLLIYSNKISSALPIESSSTITGTNVKSDNETRLAAVETGLTTKANSSHTHAISDITNLQTTLNGKASSTHNHDTIYSPLSHSHSISELTDWPSTFTPDAHSHTLSEITDWPSTFTPSSHSHSISDITNLQSTLNGKAASSHSHSISDITNLQSALDGKASSTHDHDTVYSPLSHSHTISELTDWPSTFTPSSHTHTISEITDYVPTDLSNCAKLAGYDNTFAGRQFFNNSVFMSLDVFQTATMESNTSKHFYIGESWGDGYSGYLCYTKGSPPYLTIGITGYDALKFLTNKIQALLPIESSNTIVGSNVKSDNETRLAAAESGLTTKANSSHSHAISDITNLQTTLNGKASSTHSHAIADITNLQTTLNGKAASSHSHAISDITNLQSTLNGKASSTHNHDTSYAALSHSHTISELTDWPSTFTPDVHTHAIADITNLQSTLNGKAASSHSHAISDITNLQSTLNGKAASSHTHNVSELTGWPSTFAPDPHSHTISDITDWPSSFNPSAHTHTCADITDIATTYAKLGTTNTFTAAQSFTGALYLDNSYLYQMLGNISSATNFYHYMGKGLASGQCFKIRYYYYPALASTYAQLGIYGYNAINIYCNKVDILYPLNVTGAITATGTVTGTNVKSDNETRLAAAETAISGKAASVHTHTISDLTDWPSTFTPSSHTHAIADITDWPSSFNPSAHTHTCADITDIASTYAKLSAANTFTGNQTINGYLYLYGSYFYHLVSGLANGGNVYQHIGKSTSSGQGFRIRYYYNSALANTFGQLGVTGYPSISIYYNKVDVLYPLNVTGAITSTSTITGTNVKSDNETRLAAAETAIAGKAASVHTHAISDVTNLQTTLDGKASSTHNHDTSYAALSHTHNVSELTGWPSTFAPDPHSHTISDITDWPSTFTPSSHTHTISELSDWPSTFTPSSHTHAIADITDLQTALDGKAASAHTHTSADISNWSTATTNFAKINANNTFSVAQYFSSTAYFYSTIYHLYSSLASGSSMNYYLGRSTSAGYSYRMRYYYNSTLANRYAELGLTSYPAMKMYYNKVDVVYPLNVSNNIAVSNGWISVNKSSTAEWDYGFQCYNSSMSQNSKYLVQFGKASTNSNCGYIGWKHDSDGSSNNSITLGIHTYNDLMNIHNNKVDTSVPLNVTGAITATATVTGTNVLADNETRLAAAETAITGKADSNHNHDTTYAALSHTHAISDISNLQTTLDGKAASSHNHDSTYAKLGAANTFTYNQIIDNQTGSIGFKIFQNTLNQYATPMAIYYSNMRVNDNMIVKIGKANETNNAGHIGFQYLGNKSTTNSLTFGFKDNDYKFKIYPTGECVAATQLTSPKIETSTNTPANAIGTNLTAAINSLIDAKKDEFFKEMYPIGSIYTTSKDPRTETDFNITREYSQFVVTMTSHGCTFRLLPQDTFIKNADYSFYSTTPDVYNMDVGDVYGELGGEAEHTLTVDELPSHKHWISNMQYDDGNCGGSNSNGQDCGLAADAGSYAVDDKLKSNGRYCASTGGGQAHNNMPPYMTVFMWRRTA